MFLDTPHNGLNTSNWKALYGHVATQNAEQQLSIWSTALIELGRTFTEIGNRVQITSVHARLPSLAEGKWIEVLAI